MHQTFKDKVVIVTGGANGIGKCIANEFRAAGAHVYVIDKEPGEHFVGDISKKEVLEDTPRWDSKKVQHFLHRVREEGSYHNHS